MKHEMCCRVASVALLITLLTCAGCKSNNNKPMAQTASAAKAVGAAKPSPPPYKRLVKKSGWKIPGLATAKEFRPPRLLPSANNVSNGNNGSAKVYTSSLRPPPVMGKPVTLKGYMSEEELNELGITTKNPMVVTIVKYDVGARPFCYVVKYRSTYTMEGLHFYDEDGDKNFELLETGTALPTFTPRVPAWAQTSK
jgi:hypothetical protein